MFARLSVVVIASVSLFSLHGKTVFGDEAVTLDTVTPPEANRADEPLAETFSLPKAAEFLDRVALDWQKRRKCMTCHTNYLYLMARPEVGEPDAPALATVRQFAEELVSERWEEKGPRWDAEVVMTAAVLALNDAATTGELHDLTRRALDRIWTVQRKDGGFDWLKCDWPPMESDDHYGATMAAIGVGAAPDNYTDTPAARAGLSKLRTYFENNPPPTLHHEAMLMWASSYVDGVFEAHEKAACIADLRVLQHDDGGWGAATLGDWQRGDDTQQDLESSDGYGTGFVIYVLRRAGVPADDPQIQLGIAWLKNNQRASGRWFTRSLYRDNHHFLTHAGTNMAVMALAACDALEVATTAGSE